MTYFRSIDILNSSHCDLPAGFISNLNNMKALLLAGVICSFALSSFCQEKNAALVKDKQYYLQKSRKQLTSGLISLGVGIGLFALTAANDQGIGDISTNILLIGSGSVATITGAVLLISYAGNKAKAKKASAFFSIDKMSIANNMQLQRIYYPSVGIRISRY
jgi:hypothetical protein